MGILDDAIREHLDLKRKHGARDSEIEEIEDEALGSGERPDPFAAGELFGEVSSGPATPEAPDNGPQTPPPGGPEESPPEERPIEEPTALVEPPAAPPEGPPRAEPPEPSFPEPPPSEPAPMDGPSAPEPPAESESLEELMAQEDEDEDAGPIAGADVAVPPPPPPEAGAARPEPPSPAPPAATEGQRGRARGRADVPTQEHIPPRGETGDDPALSSDPGALAGEPEAPEEGAPRLYDFETDPGLLADEGAGREAAPPAAEESDDFESLGPVEEAGEAEEDLYLSEEEEPYGEQRGGTTDFEEIEAVEADHETEVRPVVPAEGDDDADGYPPEVRPADRDDEDEDDVLSESPEFLEQDTDESLWFEKGPPKDFDFDDEDEDDRR